MPKIKSATKAILNRTLNPFSVRLVSQQEVDASRTRATRLVEELCAVYLDHVFPEVPTRKGRSSLVHSLVGTEIPEAMFLLHYLHAALETGPGEIVEMGVAQGATSALLANEILDDAERCIWLYDSFKGLSAPTVEDEMIDDIEQRGSMAAYAGAMANPRELVEERLRSIAFPADRAKIISGFLDFQMPVPQVVAFAYVDLDLYEPIHTALNMLHPHTRPGTVIMVDDYGYFSSGVATAVKRFIDEHFNEYDLHEAPSFAGHFCAAVRR